MTAVRAAAGRLREAVGAIFAAGGCAPGEAAAIAEHLVVANLMGHDSHGVIRVAKYIDWQQRGMVLPNRRLETLRDDGALHMVDGGFGYGQSLGRAAMEAAVARAGTNGVCVQALRNVGHLGRIGAWAEMAAAAGLVSVHFVNTSGFGVLVAPHGGSDRRLSANPIAAGVPRADGPPLILDMSTCVIAEGKIQVARNRGVALPEGAVIDGAGRPTRDPEAFYADPPGAILPIAAHKGSGLSILCEVLAGALTGGGSTHPGNASAGRLVNNMLSILIDAAGLSGTTAFHDDVRRLTEWVKASPPLAAGGEVLVPGEPERRTRAEREANGIPIDGATRRQLADAAAAVGLDGAVVARAIG
ncbi:MAG: malate/lactate/ureidoglycolate dehydrogenase [Alphaproteobacteria bacterium]|nr:malate/lactate/ureidoglycolate dehydrogenase [Alphaproteobacteria bacterium]